MTTKTKGKTKESSRINNYLQEGFLLEDYVATVFNVEGRCLPSTHLYKSKNILTQSQFSRLVSIFEPHKEQLEQLLSNYGEVWSTPFFLRKLEEIVSDEVWNLAGRYIDYITPDRSIGWDAKEYLEVCNA